MRQNAINGSSCLCPCSSIAQHRVNLRTTPQGARAPRHDVTRCAHHSPFVRFNALLDGSFIPATPGSSTHESFRVGDVNHDPSLLRRVPLAKVGYEASLAFDHETTRLHLLLGVVASITHELKVESGGFVVESQG